MITKICFRCGSHWAWISINVVLLLSFRLDLTSTRKATNCAPWNYRKLVLNSINMKRIAGRLQNAGEKRGSVSVQADVMYLKIKTRDLIELQFRPSADVWVSSKDFCPLFCNIDSNRPTSIELFGDLKFICSANRSRCVHFHNCFITRSLPLTWGSISS